MDERAHDAQVHDAQVHDETAEVEDVRDIVGVSVLMANGRLAPRRFGSRAEAEAWARPDEGEQVVELNMLCECDL